MPATEQIWRNMKVMHAVFGASALVMVIATLLLMAKDHSREWKEYQLTNRSKEAWMIDARREATAAQFAEQMEELETKLQRFDAKPIEPSLVEDFKVLVGNEEARLAGTEVDADGAQFGAVDASFAEFDKYAQAASEKLKELNAAGDGEKSDLEVAFATALKAASGAREDLMAEFDGYIKLARYREKQLVGKRKFVNADRTATVSTKGLKIADGSPKEVLDKLQAEIQGYTDEIAELTEGIAAAKEYRMGLEGIVKQINAEKDAATKQRRAIQTELSRLEDLAYKNTSNPLEWVTRWPVLNALYDGNVRIDQIWLPDMTINYNFSEPARFDRCKTCHQAISQTAPGTATVPAYPTLPQGERELEVVLPTPDSAPEEGATLGDVYGLVLASEGVMNYADVTVHYVLPGTLAAKAGLESGDVIKLAGDKPVYDPETVANFLLNRSDWGEPTSLLILRGFDHPFTSHPRLDLFLTDSSPHPEKTMGCTICHDGQGSGTEFPWTSHTPNNAKQQQKWLENYGWFDNHHWIFPMKPSRFAESNCTKCHHEKGGLEPSERFPEPPAPKLVEGWTLAEQYGCFGCHEINGYDGPDTRIGPDLRLEPNYAEVAQQILRDEGLSDEERKLAKRLVDSPDDDSARNRLLTLLKNDAKLVSAGEAPDVVSSEASQKLAEVLKDVESPGSYRKVGPSLRFLKAKVDKQWLYSWIEEPANFRPTTKMPQFFNLHEHLQDEGDEEQLEIAQRYEKVEIRALTEYLFNNSDEFEYLAPPPPDEVESPSVERGKWLFESRGCLACHSHDSFPGIASEQGPDLSRLGAKLVSNNSALWLYSWIKQPHRYHVRTKMPDLYLEPIVEKDATGKPTGVVTDPAADIAAFLLDVPTDWKPEDRPELGERDEPPVETPWSDEESSALMDLAQEWLSSDAIPSGRAEKFVRTGIPQELESKLKVDEKLLVKIDENNPKQRTRILRDYVARRTISKYGCFGCHDIPGYEDAKTIGTALADWGRKDTTKLAFENIHKFLEGPGNPKHEGHDGHVVESHDEDEHVAHGHLDPADFDPDTSYFIQSLNAHGRDGFIWQKLRLPRSYDYKTTKNKGYNERLRMPKFPFTPEEREAVITFVLGLVNEAPADKFIYNPDSRQKAIVDGRKVLDRFNCAGCHTLRMEQWQFAFEEGWFEDPGEVPDFPFLAKHFSDKEIADSLKADNRDMLHATVFGHPMKNQMTGQAELVDEDGLELEPDDDESDPYYIFKLWDDALVEGEPWLVGIQDLMIPAKRDGYGPANGEAYPAWGGDLAWYLFPKVIEHVQQTNPQVKGSEAWGWLPPPLMAEGEKVQTDWLHAFLMDPTSIRPAAVMRMPNFHMSSDEAAKLVNYFAAVSDVEFPYEYKSRQRDSYLEGLEEEHPERLDEAMNIVVNGNYCVKCHGVEDFYPEGDVMTFGPNLADVHRRLRPEYLRAWVANPKRILPYTGMPVNIPYKPGAPGISEALFRGTSIEQLDGLVDLLMNFDVYAKRQTQVTPLVEKAAGQGATQASGEATTTTSSLR